MQISRKTLLLLVALPLLLVVAAYAQWLMFGLPTLPPIAAPTDAPQGFPAWLRGTHYLNFLFLILLVRSGLQILADHPRMYWNVHCTPGTEWLRLTPVIVPKDTVWTAKQDSRYLSPWIGLPGYRHTVGMARHWHFLSALSWIFNGVIFVVCLIATGQWQRLAPTSWQIVPDAWEIFVHYATFHRPPEPNGFYSYNALQQLTYFAVVFGLAPLAMLTALSMSPALTARFRWYPKLPGNRQIGRSLHFLIMAAFLAFLLIHVALVALTGLARNMNHIVVGSDDVGPLGLYLGLVGIALIVGLNVLANWLAWKRPRLVQHVAAAIVTPVIRLLLDRRPPVAEFTAADISPFFWANGSLPTCAAWKKLADGNFRDYRLRIFGLVDNALELSLDDLRGMGQKTQITLHHCIQGWSGIAAWRGVPLADLIRLAQPTARAMAVVFYSFGDGIEFETGRPGGQYYGSLSLGNAKHPQTLLAYEMNGRPLNWLHGAPLRLRVENQLGFKMVKWIEAIEFVENVKAIRGGEGGYAEDHEYFGELADI